ncbi:unnamed protein product, partial [Prorocentrum cordatum]
MSDARQRVFAARGTSVRFVGCRGIYFCPRSRRLKSAPRPAEGERRGDERSAALRASELPGFSAPVGLPP